ncbi:MAG: hypothetical protein ACFFB5_09295 [Promethearchaeota archaeon]
MLQNIERIVRVEWIAQELLQRFETSGPLIETIIDIFPDNVQIKEETYKPSHYLIIQGSFDPPTLSHIDLISKAIDHRFKLDPSDKFKVILLLSLSHVDKKINVINRSLLGYRVEMLETSFSYLKPKIPISIGLSNVARYIDLIDATQQFSINVKKISFIMGMDVFKKLLDPYYYSKSLDQVLPLIFRADYLIAGREDVFSREEFNIFLNEHLHHQFHKNIHFLSMPKSYRFLNATAIREKYSKKQSIQETYLHSTVKKYLEKNNIYYLTSKRIATKIAIQLVVHLTLTAGKDQLTAIKILEQLLPEIESDTSLQQKLISEYKIGKKGEIRKKWIQISNLIS